MYFGLTSQPPRVRSNQQATTYVPNNLTANRTYYWKIVARDDHNQTTEGPVWIFTTGSGTTNNPPASPSSPELASGSVNVVLTPALTWSCSDPDDDPLTYDVRFGTTTPPPAIATGLTNTSFAPGTLPAATAHYWQIVAEDPDGATAQGPVWQFTAEE